MSGAQLLTLRVAGKVAQTQDISTFELVHPDGDALPAFTAGAHIDVHLPNGLIRQYSLHNAPSDRSRYLISVLREPSSRGGSASMHDDVRPGDALTVSLPRNNFPLAADASHSLLLAGGIGVTPILSMAEALTEAGRSFGFHYCARGRSRAAFVQYFAACALGRCVQYHFDDGDPAQKLDLPDLLLAMPAGTHLYVCGPKGFMDFVLGMARAHGWPETRLHFEFFAANAPDDAENRAFDIRLQRSGKVVRVPADQTVAQALADAGIEVPVSCGEGLCGTCLTRVIDGTPDHRDMVLTDDEKARNDSFTPCCSRAKSETLTLDL